MGFRSYHESQRRIRAYRSKIPRVWWISRYTRLLTRLCAIGRALVRCVTGAAFHCSISRTRSWWILSSFSLTDKRIPSIIFFIFYFISLFPFLFSGVIMICPFSLCKISRVCQIGVFDIVSLLQWLYRLLRMNLLVRVNATRFIGTASFILIIDLSRSFVGLRTIIFRAAFPAMILSDDL